MKTSVACAVVGGLMLAVQPRVAHAQTPPMDMSWGLRSQMQLQAIGDDAAVNAGNQYLVWAQQYRAATGYSGALPSPVSQEQLQGSVDGANWAAQDYSRAQYLNSQGRDFAVGDHGMRAVRGCTYGVNAWGQLGYICP
jgi:hypothetical protein